MEKVCEVIKIYPVGFTRSGDLTGLEEIASLCEVIKVFYGVMRIIERIEVRHFRSFDRTGPKNGIEIVDLEDLNIFSGANDSGKSNVLRALNLFLNGEVEYLRPYDVERDFARHLNVKSREDFKAKAKGPTFEISILFSIESLYESKILPKRFWLVKRFRSTSSQPEPIAYLVGKNGKRGVPLKIKRLEASITKFLKRVKFYHVPAIKDERYFRFLFKKLQDALFERSSSFVSNSKLFNDNLQQETAALFQSFSEHTGIKAQFEIPPTLVSFSEYLGVNTDGDIKLPDRGDGIQAMFIPEILEEISRNDKLVIWGFEEPENSYEYRRARELARSFVEKYSKEHQLFVTTHAKEFLALDRDESDGVSVYRVFKSVRGTSLVQRYDSKLGFDQQEIQRAFWGDEKNETSSGKTVLAQILSDLGAVEDAKLVQSFEDKIAELKEATSGYAEKQKLMKDLEEQLENCIGKNFKLTRPLVCVEDEYCQPYKIAWLKLNGIYFNKENLDAVFDGRAPFEIQSNGGATNLAAMLNAKTKDAHRKKIGVFDFDSEGFRCFKQNLKTNNGWGEMLGNKRSCMYRLRDNYSAVLLPVPFSRDEYADPQRKAEDNYLEMEHLFADSVLTETSMLNGMRDVGGGGKVIQLHTDKSKIFWKKIIEMSPDTFNEFRSLFDRIQLLIDTDSQEKG